MLKFGSFVVFAVLILVCEGSQRLVKRSAGASFSSGFIQNVRSYQVQGNGQLREDKLYMPKIAKVQKRSVFLYTRECEDEDLHKTFKAGHVWKSRCIVWTCAVTPGGAFNIPVKLECENLKVAKDGKETKECVPVGTTNLTIKRNDQVYKNCDCVWMFNQLQYHCPVERTHLTGGAAPGETKKEVAKVTDMKKGLSDSKELSETGPKLQLTKAEEAAGKVTEKPAGGEKPAAGAKPAGDEKPAEGAKPDEKPAGDKPAGDKPAGDKPAGDKPAEGGDVPLPAPEKKTKEEQ